MSTDRSKTSSAHDILECVRRTSLCSTCATIACMSTVGVRDLRQNASEILREVEAGKTATVTVAGRPVAQIVPIRAERWTTWERIREVFDSPTDAGWDVARHEFGAPGLSDPWMR